MTRKSCTQNKYKMNNKDFSNRLKSAIEYIMMIFNNVISTCMYNFDALIAIKYYTSQNSTTTIHATFTSKQSPIKLLAPYLLRK
jgi:hypothetical protein